ncbi:hypothetical protein C489_03371 [Natrinema versiforme JCM 10478]|uniref:Uncharacterized protein n=1 Tax=Natrinema versiforme JCM 10478 TaxID=1227496 RepID=L9Y7C4_9EURY|nr:hypothetical protein C489_03371 [Natrinema versiforme JCM 10478]
MALNAVFVEIEIKRLVDSLPNLLFPSFVALISRLNHCELGDGSVLQLERGRIPFTRSEELMCPIQAIIVDGCPCCISSRSSHGWPDRSGYQ